MKLNSKRENDVLLKRDLGKPSTTADVAGAKNVATFEREIEVIPNQLREWIGSTNGLTQVRQKLFLA